MRVNKKSTQLADGDERGAVAVLVALLSIVLVTCLAFAIDLGYAWQVKRSMVKATDAAALSAAHEARNTPISTTLVSGDCNPSAVQTEATTRLKDNRSDADLVFCILGANPATKNGVVTVRATTQAKLSFAQVFGMNAITVNSSSSAKWATPNLFPVAVCVGANNSDIAKWIAGNPPQLLTQTLQVSSSTNSTLCSSGSSGAFGVIDFGDSNTILPTGSTSSDFGKCRDEASVKATLLAQFADPSLIRPVNVGNFRCVTVGQYYGISVDRAICSIRGTQFVVPLVTEDPVKKTGGDKKWIVKVSGFALARLDNYGGNNDPTLCNRYAAGPGKQRRGLHPRTRLASSRHQSRPSLRKAAATPVVCSLFSLSGSNWPSNITLPNPLSLKSDITLTCEGGGDFNLKITIDPGLTGLTASDITSSGLLLANRDCNLPTTSGGIISFICKVTFRNSDVNSPNTIVSVSTDAPLVREGIIKVNACITSSTINETGIGYLDNAWPRHSLGTSCATDPPKQTITVASSTSSTSSTTTAPTTTTTLPPSDFRELKFTFNSYYGNGWSSDITSYEICRINISDLNIAKLLTC